MLKTISSKSLPEEMIITIIKFLAANEGMLQQLSLESGLHPQDLYQTLETLEVQAGIMDFLLNHEDLLSRFLTEHSFSAEDIWRFRRTLPGFMF